MKKIAIAAAMLAATTCCAPALAYESGGFVRLEAGNTEFEVSSEGLSGDSDDNSLGFRAGYYFNPFFALEGFYTRYGDDDSGGVKTTLDGFGAGAVGKYNFGANYDGFYVGGRAGIARIKTEVDASSPGGGGWDAGDTVPYLGVGIGYDFTYNLGVGLNYDYAKPKYEPAGAEVDVKLQSVTLDVEYRF